MSKRLPLPKRFSAAVTESAYDRLRALNIDEFERFCDRVSEQAAARGLTEAKLAAILQDDG